MKLSLFAKKPENYQKIDELVSRSARPKNSNIKWLKKQGVKDGDTIVIGHLEMEYWEDQMYS